MLEYGEREAIVMAPPPVHDSEVLPWLHHCLTFFQRHSPQQSSPSCPLGPCPCSQQSTLPWDCSLTHKLLLSATVHSRGLLSLSRVCRAVARIGFMDLTLFRLSQDSCCTLQQLQMLPLCSKQLLQCVNLTPAPVLPSLGCRSSPAHSSLFPYLPSFYWVLLGFKFLSGRQGLLPALSWCPARSLVSECVFLMPPWRRWTPCPPSLLLPCLLSILSLAVAGLPTFIIFRIVWPILSSWHFHRNFRVRCTPFISLVVSGFLFRAAVCCVRVKSSCMGSVFEFNGSSDHWTSLCSCLLVCFLFFFFFFSFFMSSFSCGYFKEYLQLFFDWKEVV